MRNTAASMPSGSSLQPVMTTLALLLDRTSSWLRAGRQTVEAEPTTATLSPDLRFDIGETDCRAAPRRELRSFEPQTLEGTWLRYF